MSFHRSGPVRAGRAVRRSGALLAAAAMCCVGSSVAVSQTIVGAPLFTLQAVRYALAAVLLGVLARLTGRRLPRPRGRDWAWLGGVAATGLVLFNVGVVHGEHLAVVVTALAFLLWYTAVSRIGADRAGLFTGMAPRRRRPAACCSATRCRGRRCGRASPWWPPAWLSACDRAVPGPRVRGYATGGSRATAARLARTSAHVRADGCAGSR